MLECYIWVITIFKKKICLQHSIAILPLVVYVSGFVSTFISKPSNEKLGRKVRTMLSFSFTFTSLLCF